MGYYDWAVNKPNESDEYPGLCAAFSPDGVHWTKYEQNPITKTSYGSWDKPLYFADQDVYVKTVPPRKFSRNWDFSMTMSDAVDIFYDARLKAFVYYGKMWIDSPEGRMRWKHAMGRTESGDFIHWSKPQLVLTPDEMDAPDTQFHTCPVFFYKNVYFCLNQIFYHRAMKQGDGTDLIYIELMTSRDGYHWQRPFRGKPFIAQGEPDSFDGGGIYTNSTPVVLDDTIRFYYGANSQKTSKISGVGMASIPLDRFAGLRAESSGQVTLKPLDLTDVAKIMVNADASGGQIRSEIMTEDGYRIRGYSKEESKIISGNSLKHPVSWASQNIDRLPPGKYIIRLYLENAEIYSMDMVK